MAHTFVIILMIVYHDFRKIYIINFRFRWSWYVSIWRSPICILNIDKYHLLERGLLKWSYWSAAMTGELSTTSMMEQQWLTLLLWCQKWWSRGRVKIKVKVIRVRGMADTCYTSWRPRDPYAYAWTVKHNIISIWHNLWTWWSKMLVMSVDTWPANHMLTLRAHLYYTTISIYYTNNIFLKFDIVGIHT